MAATSSSATTAPLSIVERLAEDMVARWREGSRPTVEEYLARAPAVREDPEAALELIAEELALREEYGLAVSVAELELRFPAWRAQVRALVECHRVLGPHTTLEFPPPGKVIGEFRLRAEIGRGAHGRVYLAVQPTLGDRPVILKLAPPTGHEHLSLARLQHTHIVPLYSAHEFPEAGLRGLCMPDFGGASLYDVLHRAPPPGGPTLPVTVRQAGADAAGALPPGSAAWGLLDPDTHLDAVCRIGVCLADALRYAHDRGMLHLDVKPSNVLIAADGTPMLLDFHLARPPLAAGGPAPAWLGGTPGYMAPEHLAAVQATQRRAIVPTAVDSRADVYSLGVVLTEAARQMGGLPVGLTDILARCTARCPNDRYPTAANLAADLRRHLADLPLRGVANRSLAERWTKWRRRRPLALPLALAASALVAVWVAATIHSGRQADRAEAGWRESQSLLREGRFAEAGQAVRAAESLVEGWPFRGELQARLRSARLAADRGQAAGDLHTLCNRLRPLYTAAVLSPEQVRAADAHCRQVWGERESLARVLQDGANREPEPAWRADLIDLGVLTAHLGALMAPPDRAQSAHQQALATLDQAEALCGPGLVLDLERARHAQAAGQDRLAEEAARRAERTSPRTAWEFLVVGRAALAAGDLPRADAAIRRAVAMGPGGFWASSAWSTRPRLWQRSRRVSRWPRTVPGACRTVGWPLPNWANRVRQRPTSIGPWSSTLGSPQRESAGLPSTNARATPKQPSKTSVAFLPRGFPPQRSTTKRPASWLPSATTLPQLPASTPV